MTPTSKRIPSMAEMMKKEATQATDSNEQILTEQQRAFFKKNPDLYQEFQQQQADLIQSKKDGDAVNKALFGNLTPPPAVTEQHQRDSRYYFL